MLASLIDGMNALGEGGTGARGVRRDESDDEQGQPQRHQHVRRAVDHGGVLGRRRDGAVDAAPGSGRRRDRLGRQRRAARALRQAVGVDGDHRARLRLGLRRRVDDRRARRRRLRHQRREDLRDRRWPLERRRRVGDPRQVQGTRRDQVLRRREGHARAWRSSGSSTSSASARPTPRRSASPTAACRPRTCSARPTSRPSRASPASCRPSTTPVRSSPAWPSAARAPRWTRSRTCCARPASRSTTTVPPTRQPAAAAAYLQMEADWEAAYLLTLEATWMADNRKPNSLQASMAKAKAGRVGRRHHAALRRAGRLARLQRELAAGEVGARLEDPRHLRGHPADPAAHRRPPAAQQDLRRAQVTAVAPVPADSGQHIPALRRPAAVLLPENSLDRYRDGVYCTGIAQGGVMESLAIAMVIGTSEATRQASSALPNAPVVDDTPKRRNGLVTWIAATARARRAHPATAPRVVATRAASRPTLSADSRTGAAGWDESLCRRSPTMSA